MSKVWVEVHSKSKNFVGQKHVLMPKISLGQIISSVKSESYGCNLQFSVSSDVKRVAHIFIFSKKIKQKTEQAGAELSLAKLSSSWDWTLL